MTTTEDTCQRCGNPKAEARIEFKMESEDLTKTNAKFSKCPYRVVECDNCGYKIEERMN